MNNSTARIVYRNEKQISFFQKKAGRRKIIFIPVEFMLTKTNQKS
jgi:hypothetical protein